MIIRDFSQSFAVNPQVNPTNKDIGKSPENISSDYTISPELQQEITPIMQIESIDMVSTEADLIESNLREGLHVTQIAEAALGEMGDLIRQATDLTELAASKNTDPLQRQGIQVEVRKLYDEMERILDNTSYQDIPIFKLESYETLEHKYKDYTVEKATVSPVQYSDYNYVEEIIPMDSVGFVTDSQMPQVESDDFYYPEDPESAKVTMLLDWYLLDNPSEMEGKTFQADGVNYTVTPEDIQEATDEEGTIHIDTVLQNTIARTIAEDEDYEAEEDAIYLDPSQVTVSPEGEVTLAFAITDNVEEVEIDGEIVPVFTVESNGEAANDAVVESINVSNFNSINLLSGPTYKEIVESKPIQLFSQYNPSDVLPKEEMDNLMRNSLRVGKEGNELALKEILSEDMTIEEVQEAVYDAIETMPRTHVSGKPSAFTISYSTSVESNNFTEYLFTEETATEDSSIKAEKIQVNPLPVALESKEKSAEQVASVTLQLDFSKTNLPLSIKIEGEELAIVSEEQLSHKPSTEEAENTETQWLNTSYQGDTTGENLILVPENATNQEITSALATTIQSYTQDEYVISTTENTITLSSPVEDEVDILVETGSSDPIVKAFQQKNTQPSTPVLDLGTVEFTKDLSYHVDLSSTLPENFTAEDLKQMDNVAFEFAGQVYYFNGTGEEAGFESNQSGNYLEIDISEAISYDDIAKSIQNYFSPAITDYTVDETGFTFEINQTLPTGSYYEFSNTVATNLGLFSAYDEEGNPDFSLEIPEEDQWQEVGFHQVQTATGGSNAGQSLTSIDFSSYNAGNVNELLGKGFTVTCCTCENDKHSFIFVDDASKLGELTEGYYQDEEGKEVEVSTYPIELSKLDLTSPETMVKSIVDNYNWMVSDHTLELAVDPEDSESLVVQDKRIGLMSTGRVPTLENGVYGDYDYSKESVPVEYISYLYEQNKSKDYPEGEGGFKIPVSTYQDSSVEFLDIELPFLDGFELDIDHPQPILDTIQAAVDENEKLRSIAKNIAKYRQNIAADHERIEKALTSAKSTSKDDTEELIRDVDMASELMKMVQKEVLVQAQQGTLPNTFEVKQEILNLIY